LNEQLKRLIELQKIDTEILILRDVINSFPKKITEAESPLKETELAFNVISQKLDALERKKRDKERLLEDTGEKIRKLKSRTADIKTNKEYQALLHEIESVEKEQWSTENEILTIMEEFEATSKQTKSEEAKYKVYKEKIEVLKRQLEQERDAAEKELHGLRQDREKIAETVDKESHYLYKILIEACNGLAVTEAKDEICQGCNMNIPPQLFVELKKNEFISTCPQCRRIIYYKPLPEESV
jgi:uncharacterized protein